MQGQPCSVRHSSNACLAPTAAWGQRVWAGARQEEDDKEEDKGERCVRGSCGGVQGPCWGASPQCQRLMGTAGAAQGPCPWALCPLLPAAASALARGNHRGTGVTWPWHGTARHDRGSAHTCVHQPHAHRLAGPRGPREGDVPGRDALPAPWGSSLPRACSTRLQHRQSLNLTFRKARGRLVPVPLRHGSRRSTAALGPSVAGQRLPVPSGRKVQSCSPCPDRGVTPRPRPVRAAGQGGPFAPTRSPAARGHHQPLAGSPVACAPQPGGRGSPAQGAAAWGSPAQGPGPSPCQPLPTLTERHPPERGAVGSNINRGQVNW